MSEWSDWIGREEQRQDRIDEGHVIRWLASLDRDSPPDGLVPQAFHWCLCVPDAPTAVLNIDGHPRRDENPDSFLPPVDLPRRMWASSAIQFHAPLRRGEVVHRVSRVASINAKRGGSGVLVFVDVEHETHGEQGLAVSEVQSIVYREPAPVGSPLAPLALDEGRFDPAPWQVHRVVTPSEPLLFRFSALTFNSHRIHYDLPYATAEEGFRGLVVHGPLTATLLLDLARREFGDNVLKSFAFRGNSPGICGEALHLVLRRIDNVLELGAFAADGRNIMSANGVL
ncbi:COGs COG3777 [Sphingobium indicum BiD32]|uniref:COGs COG3777 n=1 Tax=Sphingobium indicum BiD32 TaxID=1301087 RepID=N1MXM0_9SPHN|nr:MaoC family dehydratase N-terminal domain-containing protein [Sphingobium indicum]CCW20023.1 COGs COG3777 [Sphingobium indicum BiD32]